MPALTSLIPYVMAGALAIGAYFWADGRGYDRGRAELELELVRAKKEYEREINGLQAKINRLSGSLRRRCATGERLPECEELGFR